MPPVAKVAMTIAVTFVLLIVVVISYLWIRAHWYNDIRPIFAGKPITDPDDPRFDPMKFRFEYYGRGRSDKWGIPAAFPKMFPPGTDKLFIDNILIKQAGSESQRIKEFPNRYVYRWPSFQSIGGHVMLIDYDSNMKSRTLIMGANRFYQSRSFEDSLSPAMRDYIRKNVAGGSAESRRYLETKMRPIREKHIGVASGIIDN